MQEENRTISSIDVMVISVFSQTKSNLSSGMWTFALIAVIALLSLSILISSERTITDFDSANVPRATVMIVEAKVSL